jgi:hypothetical protein
MKGVQHVKDHEGAVINYRDSRGRSRTVLARSVGRDIRLVLFGGKPRTLRLSREMAQAFRDALSQLLAAPAPSDNRS